MPHRRQEIVALCRKCKTPAIQACLRCGAPLCADHAPADDQRCGPCETYYTEKTDVLQRAADGEIQASLGRFTVGLICWLMGIDVVAGGAYVLITLMTTAEIALLVKLAVALIVSGVMALLLYGLTRSYHNTPPRRRDAPKLLAKEREKFLRKRSRY